MLRFVKRTAPEPVKIAGVPGWLSALLAARGADTAEKAERFLHPSPDQLHDPLLMQGMDTAVSLIRQCIKDRVPTVVYGDYDVDGVCSTAMLVTALKTLGAEASYYIPSRHQEGYGLNAQAVRKLAGSYGLLVTVDCGITSVKEVGLAKSLGMHVIVTDHHQLGPELPPADAVLNPLIGEYPFRSLCGAGVAFKLVQALDGAIAAEYLDLAALATIADLVPLTEENRVIAALGLERIAHTERAGLRALKEAAGVGVGGKPVGAGQVAFQLAPRLNAVGRLKKASLGVELLTTAEAAKARDLAEALNQENALRQELEAEVFSLALAQVEAETDFLSDRVLIAVGEGWNSGVIGLAAGRLTERFHYPAIVLSQTGGECVGSARSIPGVNIFEMLCTCRDLFLRFGGHEQAAGLTIPAKDVPELKRRLSAAIWQACDPEVYIPVREYDLSLPLHEVTETMARSLKALEPTGLGNPGPVFLLEGGQVQDMRPVGRDGAHLKCSLYKDGVLRSAIAFQMGPMAGRMPPRVDVLFSPELNEWNGTVSVQCNIKAIKGAEGALPREAAEMAREAALQDIAALAANNNEIHPDAQVSDESVLSGVLAGAQGALILARAPETAARIAGMYGERLQMPQGLDDRRCFHTLLFPARLGALHGDWRTVILADGELLPGEAELIAMRCPKARVHALAKSGAARDLLKPLALSDGALRGLYRALKGLAAPRLDRLAERTGLSPVQVKAGLHVFSELSLAAWEEEPFSLALLPPVKRNLEDSRILRALRAAADI